MASCLASSLNIHTAFRTGFRARQNRTRTTITAAANPNKQEQSDVKLSRRAIGRAAVLSAAQLGLASTLSPLFPDASFAAEVLQEFAAIPGERFAPLKATFELPEGWKSRPGQKPKPGKFLLYTDTYGPNYRYFANWPKFKDDTDVANDSLEVVVLGLSGIESISDLGPVSALDPQRAFGLSREDLTEGAQAEIVTSGSRTDSAGQIYYEWELMSSDGNTVLISATASGGGLYAFALGATPEQWSRGAGSMKATQKTFAVARAEESTVDISGRIYGTKKAGGFN